MQKSKKIIISASIITISVFICLFFYFLTDTGQLLRTEDIPKLTEFSKFINHPLNKTLESSGQEIVFIKNLNIQLENFFMGTENNPLTPQLSIPEIIDSKSGQCYHITVLMASLLRLSNFKTRNIFIAYNPERKNKWINLLSAELTSHAVFEVKTKTGWLLVDPYRHWQAITTDGKSISLEEIQKKGFRSFSWNAKPNIYISQAYEGHFDYFYGLYSRHGKFFAPYLPLPDIRWRLFAKNFFYNSDKP